jgi:hypothetical protein
MEWQAALKQIIGSTVPIESALRSGVVQNAAQAFFHPDLSAARDRLLAELRHRAMLAKLCEASADMRRQHEELLQQPELTAAELQRLGTLSSLALVLSAQALSEAMSDAECFAHAVTQLGPWLRRAAECGVVKLTQEVGAQVVPALQRQAGAVIEARSQEADSAIRQAAKLLAG